MSRPGGEAADTPAASRYPRKGTNTMETISQILARELGRSVEHVDNVIALLDERFLYGSSRSLFPREWEDARVVNLRTVEETVREFWEETDEHQN